MHMITTLSFMYSKKIIVPNFHKIYNTYQEIRVLCVRNYNYGVKKLCKNMKF